MDDILYLIDDQGKEVKMHILFTIEANEKNYVLLYQDGDVSEETYPFLYDEEGNLFPVEDESELAMLNEALGAFEDDLADEEEA